MKTTKMILLALAMVGGMSACQAMEKTTPKEAYTGKELIIQEVEKVYDNLKLRLNTDPNKVAFYNFYGNKICNGFHLLPLNLIIDIDSFMENKTFHSERIKLSYVNGKMHLNLMWVV